LSFNFSPPFKSRFSLGLLTILFLWIYWVLTEFFIHCPNAWLSFQFPTSKTFDFLKFFKALSEFSTIVLTSIWVLALTGWTGRRIHWVLGIVRANRQMIFCLEMALGILFWVLFWLGLGLARLWFGPVWLGAMISMSLWAIPDLFRAARSLRRIKKPDLPWWFIALTVVYGFIVVIHALLPEIFYDSLNYFLGLPQFWLCQHGITDNAQQLYSGFFYGGSMFYMGGWMLGNTEGAKLLSVAVWALCGILAYGWALELSGKRAAVVASAAVLTFPLLYLNAWAVRVDGFFAFTALLFLYCLLKFFDGKGKSPQLLILSALFAGLSVSIKPTAMVVVVAALLVLAASKGNELKGRWVFIFMSFGFLGLFIIGPWLMKNWVFTGNPLFPYGAFWFGGRNLFLRGYDHLLHDNQQFLPMNQGLWSYINLFWRLTMPGEGDDQMIGPLVLAFLPGLFLFKLKEPQKLILWVMMVSFVLGFSFSHMLRFSMPTFILALILFSAVFMSDEAPPSLQWGWKISVWIFAVFFLGPYTVISGQYYQGWDRWIGQERREGFLTRQLSNSYEPLVLWTDEHLPLDARLLIAGDARGLYWPRSFYANSVFDEPFLARAARQEKDAAGILKELHESGISHVIINGTEGLRLSAEYNQYDLKPEEWAKLNTLVARGLKPLYWKNFQAIYAVKDALSDEKSPYLLNLFSFMSPYTYHFSEAFKVGDKSKAKEALNHLLRLFPQETYWHEQIQALR
jgi:4-amino-4-deoxy-L-arabinose transferase-like glycosyltransferase